MSGKTGTIREQKQGDRYQNNDEKRQSGQKPDASLMD
jgi:hypothetical protein